MSQRIQIVSAQSVAQQLRELAAGTDTPPSTLAAQIVRNGVALAAKDGKGSPAAPTAGARRRQRQRASTVA